MKRLAIMMFLVLFGFFSLGCSKKTSTQPNLISKKNSGNWLIPVSQIKDGGPGKDGIPALTNPAMVSAFSVSYLEDEDLVIGIKIGDQIRVYPHAILDWHEIVNDGMGSHKYSINYCPLTGSGMAWNRVIDGNETTFGVSGLLFNNNLIPYDRATNSNWSQMKLQAVNGELIGKQVELYSIVETTWGFWKQLFPKSLVLSNATGIYSPGQYNVYPYGDYRTNPDRLLFPISHEDRRLSRKERIHGIMVDQTTRAYRFSSFPGELTVINSTLDGKEIVIAGSQKNNFIVSFYRRSQQNPKILEFTPVANDLPNILKDQEGTIWNIFGEATIGPGKGGHLIATRSYNAYWFAWGAFWPNSEIYGM